MTAELCGIALAHPVINASGTFDAIAAISRRASTASTRAASSSAVEPMTFVMSGTGSRASSGRSWAR